MFKIVKYILVSEILKYLKMYVLVPSKLSSCPVFYICVCGWTWPTIVLPLSCQILVWRLCTTHDKMRWGMCPHFLYCWAIDVILACFFLDSLIKQTTWVQHFNCWCGFFNAYETWCFLFLLIQLFWIFLFRNFFVLSICPDLLT